MEQMLTDAGSHPGKWYHIAYYIKNGTQPVISGENVKAENIRAALEQFCKMYPNREGDVLYIVEQFNKQ